MKISHGLIRRPTPPTIRAVVDSPRPDELVYQHGFDCQGWVHDDARRIRCVQVTIDGILVGSTEFFFERADVATAHNRDDMLRIGFTVRCSVPDELRQRERVELHFEVGYEGSVARTTFAVRQVLLSKIDYRLHGHGSILNDTDTDFLKREQVYGSGPPSPVTDSVCTQLVLRYLEARSSVLDVGCGIGAWCAPLQQKAIEWTGCETRADFVARMLAASLRAIHVDGDRLPFDDRAFDQTICIEVLEHIPQQEAFLAEVARVSRYGGLFSVPNFAAVPVTSSFYALPWHMLESDHKNFFTARSLERLLRKYYQKVETFEYGPLPNLRSLDGLQIKNHVFAVAKH